MMYLPDDMTEAELAEAAAYEHELHVAPSVCREHEPHHVLEGLDAVHTGGGHYRPATRRAERSAAGDMGGLYLDGAGEFYDSNARISYEAAFGRKAGPWAVPVDSGE